MRNDGLNAHAEKSTRATGSIVFIQAHFQVSSARLESRVLNHTKIADPPPGIEPGPSTSQGGAQPLHLFVSFLRGVVVAHLPGKGKAQVQFLLVN